jgi:transcriptional regulator with XRE-family HTH domain
MPDGMLARESAVDLDVEPLPDGEARRQELADFLRSRRERATPEQVGIIPGSRRRTPGLRREEVAGLAGVGVTWYTWLEQGRDINVSDQVLDAVARTLHLDRYEREHLFTLAGSATAQVARECDNVAPGTLLVLDRLGNYPAMVINGRYDVLAYNRAFEALIGDLGSLSFDERNILWLVFTSTALRELLVDWEQVARTCVARYRARMATHASERPWRFLVKRLAGASDDFARIWNEHEVTGTDTTLKRFAHPELGLVTYHAAAYSCQERLGHRLIAYTPADEVTMRRTEALMNLAPRPLSCASAA